ERRRVPPPLTFRTRLWITQVLTFFHLLAAWMYPGAMAVEQVHETEACKRVNGGITRVFQLLGKRWTGPIVAVLVEQPAYFADLRRAIPGISERMLSDRLTELGAAGL